MQPLQNRNQFIEDTVVENVVGEGDAEHAFHYKNFPMEPIVGVCGIKIDVGHGVWNRGSRLQSLATFMKAHVSSIKPLRVHLHGVLRAIEGKQVDGGVVADVDGLKNRDLFRVDPLLVEEVKPGVEVRIRHGGSASNVFGIV